MIRTLAARLALAGSWYLALGGCSQVSTLPEGPFQQYHTSVAQLAASADQALAAEQQLTYRRYIDTVASTGELGQLQLQPDLEATVFDMKVEDVPLFQEIRDTRANLAAMHALVEQYAELLLVLAGASDASTHVDAVAVASELHTNASSLAAMLGADPELLKQLHAAYGALPGAHLQLQTTVVSGAAPSASALLAYAESLRDRYRNFSEE